MIKVRIQKNKETKVPEYAHKGDAGVDLYSAQDYVLESSERTLISTGIKIAVPPGYEAQIRPKSGLAIKHGISVLNTPGTVDSGYRGEVMVIAVNLSNEKYHIKKGDKVAQMVFNKVEEAEFVEVKELDKTSRNEGGFGSTGKR